MCSNTAVARTSTVAYLKRISEVLNVGNVRKVSTFYNDMHSVTKTGNSMAATQIILIRKC